MKCCFPITEALPICRVSSLKLKRVQVLTQHSVKFTRLDRIRDEIAELGDVAVSVETDVVNRQQVKSNYDSRVVVKIHNAINLVIFATKIPSNRLKNLEK